MDIEGFDSPPTLRPLGRARLIMRSTSEAVRERAKKSATDRIRDNYDTTNLRAIMGRYYDAVMN